jgi:hypothetical protein
MKGGFSYRRGSVVGVRFTTSNLCVDVRQDGFSDDLG